MSDKNPNKLFIELAAKCQILSDISSLHALPNNHVQPKTKKAVEDAVASAFLTLKELADTELLDFESIIHQAESMYTKGKAHDTKRTEPTV